MVLELLGATRLEILIRSDLVRHISMSPEVQRLEQEMEEAISLQEFERAAMLRDRALQLRKEAEHREPPEQQPLARAAWMILKRKPGAADLIEQAHDQASDRGDYWLLAGDAAALKRNSDAALEFWKRAAELDASLAERVKERLRHV